MSNGTTNKLIWAGSVIASIVILSFVIITVLSTLGVASLSPIGQSWFIFYTTLILLSCAQLYGKETLEAVKSFRET